MSFFSRRHFLKMGGGLLASLGWAASGQPTLAEAPEQAPAPDLRAPDLVESPDRLGQVPFTLPEVAEALEALAGGDAALVWLHGQACSGCSVSFLNAAYPDPAAVLTRQISLEYHATVSAATGATALQALERRLAAGNYILVAEGAVPRGMPSACVVGDEPYTQLLTRAAQKASAVIALGTCAAFGGVPAAPPNPTGAVSVAEFLGSSVSAPIVHLPGCPAHPDWLVGTLVYLLKAGVPPLTDDGSPAMFYGSVIHSQCPEFYNYNAGKYAQALGEPGCLFKLGCLGIRTYADCSTRRWNNGVNWCVGAGAPCLGCARPEFAADSQFPFYRLREQTQ